MPNPITEKKPEPDPRDASPKMDERSQPGLKSGSFPAKAFFALFDDRDAALRFAEQIDQAGVEDAVKIWSQESDADQLDPDKAKEPTGLIDRLVRIARELSDFKTFLGECADLVRSGRTLLLTPCEDEADCASLEGLVKEHGGIPLAHTDNWTLVRYVQTSDIDREPGSSITPS